MLEHLFPLLLTQLVGTSHTSLPIRIIPWMELRNMLLQDGYGLRDRPRPEVHLLPNLP